MSPAELLAKGLVHSPQQARLVANTLDLYATFKRITHEPNAAALLTLAAALQAPVEGGPHDKA